MAATVLRIGRTTLYALMKAGDLRPVHIGRSRRITRAELARYVTRLQDPVSATCLSEAWRRERFISRLPLRTVEAGQ